MVFMQSHLFPSAGFRHSPSPHGGRPLPPAWRTESPKGIGTTPKAPAAGAICAVIVTYHPDSTLVDRVERLAKQVAQTVIVDNGSSEACVEQLRRLANQLGIHLILNPRNEGIARALNMGARWAIERGYLWILTLDQDTTVLPEMVHSLGQIARRCPFHERLAVVGSNYIQKENGKIALNLTGSGDFAAAETKTALTSGSLVSLDVYRSIGGFREDFFIDCVDHEYCLRARAHGFRIIVSSRPMMEHGIGNLTEHRLLWRAVGTSNHPPSRHYFLARNTLILAREYVGKEPRWVVSYLWAWVKSILRVCLFEKERISKAKHIIRGCIDGASWILIGAYR